MDLKTWWKNAPLQARRQLAKDLLPNSTPKSREVYLGEVRRNKRRIRMDRAVEIEKLTKGAVRAWTLRPDVFPRGTRIVK